MIPCSPETEGIVQGVKQFVDAGFDRVALVQVGDRQKEFCEFYRSELAEALRAL
jgi:coenzyme F420-dependent glucose-6-phosphate dehydrogenase